MLPALALSAKDYPENDSVTGKTVYNLPLLAASGEQVSKMSVTNEKLMQALQFSFASYIP